MAGDEEVRETWRRARTEALKLLQTYGFSDAARRIDEAMPSIPLSSIPSMPLDQNESLKGAVSTYASSDREPKRFMESYRKLRDWIHGSTLDEARRELVPLLYPVFIHLFLELLNRRAESDKREGRALLKAFASEHKNNENKAEFSSLEKLSNPDNVKSNQVAQLFLQNRYTICMSQSVHDLLMRHLRNEELYAILHIINNHIYLRIVPDGIEGDGGSNGLGTGHVIKSDGEVLQVDVVNKTQIHWGGLVDSKGARKDAPNSVPHPAATHDAAAAAVEDARIRVTVNSGSLPSVAMFTIQQTASTLNAVAFTNDGSTTAGGYADSSISLFDTQDNHVGRTLRSHSGPICGLSFSPDAKLLASSSIDSTICLWSGSSVRRATGEALGDGPLVCLRGHSSAVWDVSFSPLGYYMVSASRDKTARIWATDRAHPVRILAGHIGDVDIARWHPNCNYIATGSSDRTIRLWDAQSGETVRLLTGHSGAVTSLAFSPDGYTLASGGDAGAVLLWDLRTGRRVATLQQHTGPVWALAFERNTGEVLVSSAADCSIRIWSCKSVSTSAAGANGTETNGAVATGGGAAPVAVDDGLIRQPQLLKVLYSKYTPAIALQFTNRNLLLAGGALDLSLVPKK